MVVIADGAERFKLFLPGALPIVDMHGSKLETLLIGHRCGDEAVHAATEKNYCPHGEILNNQLDKKVIGKIKNSFVTLCIFR